ncbi:MAG TPA: hypothetical protein VIF62_00490 [Labilithrix sp.]|jgi:hypothetical protein
MRVLLGFAIAAGAFVACGGSQPAPAPAPAPSYDPYAAYYPPQDPNAPPAYPTAPPAYPTAPAPTAPPPATSLSTPGPLALPCQQDSACILARCNVQYQKCVFPCQTPADCAQGASCNTPTGLCLPGG